MAAVLSGWQLQGMLEFLHKFINFLLLCYIDNRNAEPSKEAADIFLAQAQA